MFKRSFFFRYLSPYTGRIVFNVFLRTLAAVFTVVLLLCIAPMLSLLFSDGSLIQSAEPGQSALSENLIDLMKNWVNMSVQCYGKNKTLLLITWTLMFLYFLKNTFSYLGLYYFTPIRNGVVASLRNDLYIRLIILPLSFFSVHKKGDLMSRLSSDLQEIDENILKQIQQVLIDIVTFLFMLAALFFISTPLTLFVLFILPIAGISTGFLSKSLRRSSPKQQASLGRLTSQLEESIQGIKTIRSYNTTSFSIAKFKQENTVFNNLKIQVCHRVDLSSPVSEFIGTIAIVGLLILGGYFILGSESTSISPEAFITYLVTLTQILPSSKNIATAYYGLQRGKGSVARIKDILYADEVITQKENALAIKDLTHNIEFRHVGFTYHNDEVLHDINLIIPKGKNIAIVGPSGGGKSTLIDLVPRFYDCCFGEVLIDGQNIKDYSIDDIRQLSALVSQDTILFNDTIFNNIKLGNQNASREDVITAAKKAYAHDFITSTENGYETIIGDSGTKLSGGQRQRLSIARALLKDAPILIFDEASSALDTESENVILHALKQIGKANKKTIISIAHRLSTIQHSDEIIVIDKGRIIERGTHESLYQENGLYTKLCNMQNL